MAESLAALQVAASIIQVIDVGIRVVQRLREYHDNANDLPDAFKHVSKRLPIFIETLRQTKSTIEIMSDSARKALRPAIEECLLQIHKLETMVDAALPKSSDSEMRKSWKAVISVKYDSEVKNMDRVIKDYMEVVSQHQISSLAMQTLNGTL
jgi:hypothetical protein